MTARRPTLWRGVLEEYAGWLPSAAALPRLTLGEGGTPLVRSDWLSAQVDCDVWLKVEGGNPTASFKDRGMVVAVAHAMHEGARAVVCASTGNTSASMAAYASRAGLLPLVLVPEGRVSRAKLAQAVLHEARIISVRTGFDGCLGLARRLAEQHPVALVNSVNPMRREGQKTAAFEIVDALGRAPDLHVMPVGNAGNISSYWQGFLEYHRAGVTTTTPTLWGIQATGAAPLVHGVKVDDPETVASAIRIGNPASWRLADEAVEGSGGVFDAVSDAEILAAQRGLAGSDGVFVEPASATGVAGLLARHRASMVESGQTITVTLTGHGLKDIETPLSLRNELADIVVDDDVRAVAAAAGFPDA